MSVRRAERPSTPSATSSSGCGSASTSTGSSTRTTARPSSRSRSTPRRPIDAAQLAADGDALLAELDDGWLRDQVQGCATYAHVLAGDEISYVDEVEGCYGVRPAADADERLRGGARRARRAAPGRRLAVRAPSGVARPAPRRRRGRGPRAAGAAAGAPRADRGALDLPAGEQLTLEPVSDEPWWAFNYYLGDLRSRVVLNIDVPTTGYDLIHLAAHEVYPGHHTEHAVKEQLLLRDRGAIEEGIQLVPTPQAVLSEGIAETGAEVVLDDAARRGGLHGARAARHRRRPGADRAGSRRRSKSCSARSASTRRS